MRVRILVDFWNLQIAWNKFHEERGDGRPPIPWDTRLPDVLTRRASGKGSTTGVTCTRRSIRVTPRMLGFAASCTR